MIKSLFIIKFFHFKRTNKFFLNYKKLIVKLIKATPKEVSQLRDYIIGMRQYQDRQFNVMRNQMNAQMSRMFSPGFPFNIPAADAPVAQMPADNVLPIPKAPCLCPSNCNSLVMLSSNLNGL